MNSILDLNLVFRCGHVADSEIKLMSSRVRRYLSSKSALMIRHGATRDRSFVLRARLFL